MNSCEMQVIKTRCYWLTGLIRSIRSSCCGVALQRASLNKLYGALPTSSRTMEKFKHGWAEMTRTFRNGIVLQSKWRARTSWEQATSDLISLGMCRVGWVAVVVVVTFGWDNSKRITKWKIKCRHGTRWRIGNVSRPWRTFFYCTRKRRLFFTLLPEHG